MAKIPVQIEELVGDNLLRVRNVHLIIDDKELALLADTARGLTLRAPDDGSGTAEPVKNLENDRE